MENTDRVEFVSVGDIAYRLGVARATVMQWRVRSHTGKLPVPFPEPVLRFGATPVWLWKSVHEWAQLTGRAKDEE